MSCPWGWAMGFFYEFKVELWSTFLSLYPQHNKVDGGYIGFIPSVHPSVHLSVHPAFRVRSVTPTVLDGFFPAWEVVSCTMTFDFDLYLQGHSCPSIWPAVRPSVRPAFRVCSVTPTVLGGEGVSHLMTFDLDLYLQGHSAMTLQNKLLNYGTSCARSTARTILDGFFSYWAQMITGMRGCHA